MELSKGETLDKVLQSKKTMSESETHIIASAVLNALKQCHNKNVIHGNINLMSIIDSNEIKLIDFSLGVINYVYPDFND